MKKNEPFGGLFCHSLKKILLIMRIAVILLLACFLQMQANDAYSQKTKLSVNSSNTELVNVLDQIEIESDFLFLYNEKLVDTNRKVSINVQDQEIEDILKILFSGTNVEYSILGRKIILAPKESTQPQLITVSGKVTDSSFYPLPGVTVVLKGTTKGTITNTDGNYSMENVPSNGILVFSFVGMQTQEKECSNQSRVDVQMQESSEKVGEVVVTALNIKREEKQLGYSQQTVNTELLSSSIAPNWSSGLKGKVAGLNIISGGTGPINSQSIQVRGATSLDPGSNHALIVVDGVPMSQETTAYGNDVGAAYGTETPVDYGNAVSELNQEDIESVSVLKGPSAAALYGSRAANGALIITTKSGKKNQQLGVTINSTAIFDRIINWPDYQYEYGAGGINRLDANGNPYYSWGDSEDGPSTNTPEAYGPKFEGQYYYQYDPETQSQGAERTLWKPYRNNMKDFYNTGMTFQNFITLQGGDDKGSMRLNLSYTDNKYIVPNSGYKKNSVSFNSNYQISKRIKLSTVLNYKQQE